MASPDTHSVNAHGGCLACGMTEHGSFEGRVVEWQTPDKTLLRATGCGDFYQPYGVTDVAPTKALIAELALGFLNGKTSHPAWHTWVGDLSRLYFLAGSCANRGKLNCTHPNSAGDFSASHGNVIRAARSAKTDEPQTNI